MAPPIDAREKLGNALRHTLMETPLSKISVSALTRTAGVTRQAFYYHFASLNDLNAWVFREEVAKCLTESSEKWTDALTSAITWMHEHSEETIAAMNTIPANELWTFFASTLQPVIQAELPSSYSAAARETVANHFSLAASAHIAQWLLSSPTTDPSLRIAAVHALMDDQAEATLVRMF